MCLFLFYRIMLGLFDMVHSLEISIFKAQKDANAKTGFLHKQSGYKNFYSGNSSRISIISNRPNIDNNWQGKFHCSFIFFPCFLAMLHNIYRHINIQYQVHIKLKKSLIKIPLYKTVNRSFCFIFQLCITG